MTDEQEKPSDEPTEFGLPAGEIAGAETPAGEDEDANAADSDAKAEDDDDA